MRSKLTASESPSKTNSLSGPYAITGAKSEERATMCFKSSIDRMPGDKKNKILVHLLERFLHYSSRSAARGHEGDLSPDAIPKLVELVGWLKDPGASTHHRKIATDLAVSLLPRKCEDKQGNKTAEVDFTDIFQYLQVDISIGADLPPGSKP